MPLFPIPAPTPESTADLADFQVAAITTHPSLQDDAPTSQVSAAALEGLPGGQIWDDLYEEVTTPDQRQHRDRAGQQEWWRLIDAAVYYLLAERTAAELTAAEKDALCAPWRAGFTPARPEDITALTDRQGMMAVGAWTVCRATAMGFSRAQGAALAASEESGWPVDPGPYASAAAARFPAGGFHYDVTSAAVWHARALAGGSSLTAAQRQVLALPWHEATR